MLDHCGSWGLSLFVLFELSIANTENDKGSWGLSLFVLFEQNMVLVLAWYVLED